MEAVKLKEPLAKVISVSRCENCGYQLRHWDKTGQRKWCERCIDVWHRKEDLCQHKAEALISDSVGVLYLDATLDDLDPNTQDKLLNLEDGQDVFMTGPVGVGKTHAMAALFRHYVYQGFECRRINFDSFCVKVRSTFAPAAKVTAWEMTGELKNVDKLFIDDLGLRGTPESQFAYDTFYDILNKRQERMLPTFISSNKDTQQLGRSFDQRIASRLQTALVIEMSGQDRRELNSARPKKV